jgi:predicted ArsR family transcriptional regulator
LSNNSNYIEWDLEFQKFLRQWFSGLAEGLEKLNDATWPKVLEMTGRACAQVHSSDLFKKTWEESTNFDDFIFKINKTSEEETYTKIDENTLSVSYSQCRCPLVKYGLINTSIICNCSPNWLVEKFEPILGNPVAVTTEKTILTGAKSCSFTVTFR